MRPSFSDNPLLRVSRPVSACSRCRSAKVRCDGKLPACTACEKAGREHECSSANDQFARGKERSYVAALELRIEKLTRRLAFAKSRMASVSHHESDLAPPASPPGRKDSLAMIKAAIHRKAARTRENSDVNSLVSDFGFLSVNATTRDFDPSVSNMTFARLVLAAATNELLLMPPSDAALPPRQVALETIQYYMKHIYPLLPAFSETSLFNTLNDMYNEDDRMVSDSDRWTLLFVLAVGSSAQSKRCDDGFYTAGTGYVAQALAYADRALAPGYPSQIQCLLLLTQYAMLDPAHFDSWLLIGFASRAAVDLGFHQDPPPKAAPDKATLDMRRKIFYCVYALDRAISMVHARAFSFTDSAVNVAFPSPSPSPSSHQDVLRGPQPAEPALLHFQLRRAQSHWYQDLCQSRLDALPDPQRYIWRMCLDMGEWSDHLPNTLPPPVRELFDLELRYSYVYCIGARAQLLTDYGRLLIFEHAIAYLDAIYSVAHGPDNLAFYTYHDALKVYFMASQLAAVLRDAEDLLLSGAPPGIPMTPPSSYAGVSIPPPPIPARRPHAPGETNVTRSLRCLEGAPLTLKRWGERWVDALKLGESFELVFGQVMGRLRARKSVEDTMQPQRAPSPPPPIPQPSPHQKKLAQSASPPPLGQQSSPHQQLPHQQLFLQGPPPLRHVNSAGPPALRHVNSSGPPLRHQNSMGPHPGPHQVPRPYHLQQQQQPVGTQLQTSLSPQYAAAAAAASPVPSQMIPGNGQWMDVKMAHIMAASPQQQPVFPHQIPPQLPGQGQGQGQIPNQQLHPQNPQHPQQQQEHLYVKPEPEQSPP